MKKQLEDLTAEDWGRLFPIKIVPYNPEWKHIFEREKVAIQSVLSNLDSLEIEHFGSTAVPNLPSKDIIDILVAIPSSDLFASSVIDAMKSIGYHYFLQQEGEASYMVFGKGYHLDGNKEQLFHIHMSVKEHPIWDRVYFRDYLRQHPAVAQEYAALKYKLAEEFKHQRVDYRVAKTAFVTRITQLATTIKDDSTIN